MSTATAVEGAAPPKGGKKKLIVLLAVVLLLVLAGGGAAVYVLKQRAHAEQDADDDADGAHPKAAARRDPKAVPVYLALDSFTVNLADREAERYAQIGVTLEIEDAKTGDQIKTYMPAIRNNILMAIADRTAADLLGRDGKTRLAQRIARETSRALGYAVEDEPGDEAATAEDDHAPAKKPAKKRKKSSEPLPVKAVHFSNFIIQ